MQFERLELKNFEGYKNAEIDFAKGLNIITGRNSTGKTTLLEALLFPFTEPLQELRKSF
jgi:DNA repair exonuclease SbcCD ATPase subunit